MFLAVFTRIQPLRWQHFMLKCMVMNSWFIQCCKSVKNAFWSFRNSPKLYSESSTLCCFLFFVLKRATHLAQSLPYANFHATCLCTFCRYRYNIHTLTRYTHTQDNMVVIFNFLEPIPQSFVQNVKHGLCFICHIN